MNATAPTSRSGRFSSGPAADVAAFSQSISYDWRLWRHDIIGSIAHAGMLATIGILTASELRQIQSALTKIGEEIEAGTFEWKAELEDVHMNIEAELTRRVPAGAKLHTGRSRNDQIATDMRMWLRDEIIELRHLLQDLQRSLHGLGKRYPKVIIPGYTHLQRAQPVFLAHHLLAYVEMLERDRDRLQECFYRTSVCPLGSGAIAGSTLPLDRAFVAKALGFVDPDGVPRLTQNSMDAVSDRDFIVEFCSAGALIAVHLSRLAEDVILWATPEFGFIGIGDAYTTGSSLMPQKRNPDVAELTRGKSGRVIGNLVALLTLLKGLPMTYNRDLQEDKERLFDTADTVKSSLQLMAAMLNHTMVHEERCRSVSNDPTLLATDLADYLVLKGVPFRKAHHAVGEAVSLAEAERKPLNGLSLKQLQGIHPEFDEDVFDIFQLEKSMKRRNIPGAPGDAELEKQMNRWHSTLHGGKKTSRKRSRRTNA